VSDGILDALVIGSGISGLGAAVELRAAGHRVRVLEAGDRPGGVIRTDRREGFCLERGANAFRVPAPLYAWLLRHGLDGVLLRAGPEARMRALFLDGRLLWLPESLPGAVTTPLLSTRAKLRAVGEIFLGGGDGRDETVTEFVTRRFGKEILERAVAPFLTGVYAGDEDQLGAEAVFPQLVAWERSHGSVLRGALRDALRRGRPRGLPGSHSTATGVAGFVDALAQNVGDAVTCGARVDELACADGEVVARAGGSVWRARSVVVALPAREAGALLAPRDSELRALFDRIVYAPMASVALSVDPKRSRERIRGFGFLVPRQAGLRLLGALFPARVFPDRAPAGRELVMAMVGGTRWPGVVDASDEALLEAAQEGLDRTLGAEIAEAPLAIRRWPRAVPQPGPLHAAQIRELRAAVARTRPGVELAGSYLDGVSVGDALLSGVRAAQSLIPAQPTAEPG
jgi:oxygen-dependent protoporphyrinogen oxidase